MAFDNVVFPIELAALSMRSAWSTTVVALGGGNEQRNVNWGDARRRYNAKNSTAMTLANFRLIEKHFNARRGRGRAFPILDRSNFTLQTEVFGTGDGSTTQFQLKYDEGDAGNAYQREIYLPITGTIHVFDNTVEVIEGAGAGKFQVPYSGATAGLVTFGTAPVSGHSLTVTTEYYVPIRYDTDELDGNLFVWTADGNKLVEGPDIPLVEVRYQAEW